MTKDLTVREAIRQLDITIDAAYRLIYANRLAATKVDGRWMIPASAVQIRLKERAAKNGQ